MNFAERILETLRWRPIHPRPTFIVYAPPAFGGRGMSETDAEHLRRHDQRRRRPRPAPRPSVCASVATSPLCAADAAP